MKAHPLPKITYLLKTWPKISETFVLQEILALQYNDISLHIASLQQPTDHQCHDEVQQVRAVVDYLDEERCHGGYIAACVLDGLLRHPKRWIKTLIFLRQVGEHKQRFYQACCLARQIRQQGTQHIHAHFASEPTAVAELVNQLTGISYSISAHAKDIYLSPQAVLRRKIASAQFVVTCTEYNCRYLQQLNDSSTPVVRVYHGFDPGRFQTAASVPATPRVGPLQILSVGRLREKKGFVTLIKACHQLKQAGYLFRCDIVGYGPQQTHLQALIQSLNLQQSVRLRGQLIHTELIALYGKTDIFALPCQVGEDGDRDGIPNVLMEAMAMNIPVISSRISGIPELIEHRISGWLIEPNDPEQLLLALLTLLNDQPLRQRLGRAGRQRVINQFAVAPNIELLQTLFKQTLQEVIELDSAAVSSKKGAACAS